MPGGHDQADPYAAPNGHDQSGGYGAPSGHGAPGGYAPSNGYGPPTGQDAPTGYGAPDGYGEPTGHGAPDEYGASTGYGHAERSEYGAPARSGHAAPDGYGASSGYGHAAPDVAGEPTGHRAVDEYGAPAGPGHAAPDGYGGSSGYGHEQSTSYGASGSHGSSDGYGASTGYEASAGPQGATGYGPSTAYEAQSGYGAPSAYEAATGHEAPAGYVAATGYEAATGLEGSNGYGAPTGYEASAGYAAPTGHGAPAGYANATGYEGSAGYEAPTGDDAATGREARAGFEASGGRDRSGGHGSADGYGSPSGYPLGESASDGWGATTSHGYPAATPPDHTVSSVAGTEYVAGNGYPVTNADNSGNVYGSGEPPTRRGAAWDPYGSPTSPAEPRPASPARPYSPGSGSLFDPTPRPDRDGSGSDPIDPTPILERAASFGPSWDAASAFGGRPAADSVRPSESDAVAERSPTAPDRSADAGTTYRGTRRRADDDQEAAASAPTPADLWGVSQPGEPTAPEGAGVGATAGFAAPMGAQAQGGWTQLGAGQPADGRATPGAAPEWTQYAAGADGQAAGPFVPPAEFRPPSQYHAPAPFGQTPAAQASEANAEPMPSRQAGTPPEPMTAEAPVFGAAPTFTEVTAPVTARASIPLVVPPFAGPTGSVPVVPAGGSVPEVPEIISVTPWGSDELEEPAADTPEIAPWDRRPLMIAIAAGLTLIVIGVLSGLASAAYFGHGPTDVGWRGAGNRGPKPSPSASAAGAPGVAGDTITLSGVGDVIMGTEPGDLPPQGGAGIFDPVKSALASDLVMGNLETPLTPDTGRKKCPADPSPSPGATPTKSTCFQFFLPESYADHLRDGGFQVMNLANNHTNDMGPVGLSNTRSALTAAGLQHTGAPNQITYVTVKGFKIAVLGFSVYSWGASLNNISAAKSLVAKAAQQSDLVVIQMQGGAEGADKAHVKPGHEIFYGEDRGDLIAFSHAVIDAGADVVFGHGPHVMRGMEFYKGRLIAYSLGNFCGYGVLSATGYLGVGGVLRVTLKKDGTWAGGSLVATEMVNHGLPAPDPDKRALAFVDGLSKTDFGAAAAHISAVTGEITAPTG